MTAVIEAPVRNQTTTPEKMSAFADTAWCARCKTAKPHEDFSKNKRYTNGLQSYCKSCVSDYRVENRARIDAQIRAAKEVNPNKYRDQFYRSHYGIGLDKYNELLEQQDGLCAICDRAPEEADPRGRALHVDHDHSCCSGKKSCGNCVRGLLCSNCNFGIGSLQDDAVLLRSAANYLESFK